MADLQPPQEPTDLVSRVDVEQTGDGTHIGYAAGNVYIGGKGNSHTPPVNSNQQGINWHDPAIIAAVIGGIFALIVGCVGGIFLIVNTIIPFWINQPTPTVPPPTTVVAANITDAPTATETPTVTMTATATPSASPIHISQIVFQVQSISGSQIGNGRLRVYYSESVDFPETIRIELELAFDNYYITPTPFGPLTVVPANTGTPLAPQTIIPTPIQPTSTPNYESLSSSVEFHELMGASLICLPTSFNGCDDEVDVTSARRITLDGVKWTWIIAPLDGVQGSQDLRLELWRLITIGDSSERTEVVWDHSFQIDVQPKSENSLSKIIEDNITTIIGSITAVIVALISGGYFISRHQGGKSKKTSSETNG